MIDLNGKVALVTGGSRGIGRAVALKLARAGADVALTYLNAGPNAQEVGEAVLDLGRRTLVAKADLSRAEDVGLLVDAIADQLGGLDIVVSNAAGGGFRSLMDVSPDNFDYAMHLNARAFLLLAQRAAPYLERSPDRGRLIGLSSWGSERALPMYGAIGATKAALESLVRHAALELGPRNVNANCVRAGVVDTGALRALPGVETVLEERKRRSLTGQNTTPEDVADAVLFLASPLSRQIQGQVLVIDGGTSLHP
jgi:enoyl-[acyl-carrier protein] reductase III